MEDKKSKIGAMVAYLYIMLPFLIFSMTWMKKVIGYPIAVLMIIALVFLYKHAPELPVLKFKIEHIILIFMVILLWVYLSGIGGYVYQNIDHHYRNGMFKLLVENTWPVEKVVYANGKNNVRGMVYYIGFWLPAASFGKIFGIEVGYFAQFVWSVVGILIVYYLICCCIKKTAVWPLLIFIFFGGLDLIAYYVTGNSIVNIGDWVHLEQWVHTQFSSFSTQLFWVYNQAIPAWLITMLLYLQKNNKSMIFIWSMGMILCTIPFVGMIPFLFYFMVRNIIDAKQYGIKNNMVYGIKSIMSYENILIGAIVGIISFLFLLGNTAVAETVTKREAFDTNYLIMQYIITIVFEVGIYYLVIYKYNKKNPLLYISFIWFLICPLVKIGLAEDFCMRASIPAQIILYIMIVDTIIKQKDNKEFIKIIILLIIISSFTGIHEINRTITNTMNGDYERQYIDDDTIMMGGNFSGNVKDNIFYKYLAEFRIDE